MVHRPHTWAILTSRAIADGKIGYLWFAVCSLVMAICLPPYVLLCVFRPCLLEVRRITRALEDSVRGDDRTEWQWYVDRISCSTHCANDPLTGRPVREAEHLFQGRESILKLPFLLDRKILSEHAYIVGETGSGKTSLGILPLLLQLIRGHYRRPSVSTPESPRRDSGMEPVSPSDSPDSAGEPEADHSWRRPSETFEPALRPTEADAEQSGALLDRDATARTPASSQEPALTGARPPHCPAGLPDGETTPRDSHFAADLLGTTTGTSPLADSIPATAHSAPTGESLPRVSPSSFTPPPPMVIIDLKGDPALFHTVHHEVEERRRQMGITDPLDPRYAFRFFTSEKGKATHHFNPFKSLETTSRSLIQVCHLFLDSLSLSHGEGYGRSYYSRKNRYLLYEALDEEPRPRSFEELFDRITARVERSPQLHRDAFELVSTIHALSRYPQLATFEPLKRPEDAIHMPSVLEHSQVVYFWLPAVLESISVREIAKLALFCLLSAAIDRQRERQPTRQTYVVIDEFQRIAGENFRVILEQARSFGLATILANQSQGDLVTRDVDLRSTVRSNTRFKQYFGLSDPREIADLCEVSGQEVATMRSWTMSAKVLENKRAARWEPHRWFHDKTESEFIKSRLTVNDLLAVTDHPLDSIIQVSRGEGYTQYGGFPVPVRSTWPIHFDEYKRRQQAPWPTRDEYELETLVPDEGPGPHVDLRPEGSVMGVFRFRFLQDRTSGSAQ